MKSDPPWVWTRRIIRAFSRTLFITWCIVIWLWIYIVPSCSGTQCLRRYPIQVDTLLHIWQWTDRRLFVVSLSLVTTTLPSAFLLVMFCSGPLFRPFLYCICWVGQDWSGPCTATSEMYCAFPSRFVACLFLIKILAWMLLPKAFKCWKRDR
jgi:hypothetical protein